MVIDMTETPKNNEEKAEKWWKTTLANVVGAFILVSAMLFFIWQKYTDGIMLLVG